MEKYNTKYVIYAVGPKVRKRGTASEDDQILLQSAVKNVLIEAHELKISSILVPAISTGIYSFPILSASKILIQTTIDHFNSTKQPQIGQNELLL